jgi:hypothetical protein
MGVCCNKKNAKLLDMDFIWESLPIRKMSLVEYKKRIFIISSMNLNDINSFEKIFMRDLLLHGNDESQQAIRDLFISFAKEKSIPLVIFILLFLCRNDESIDKSYIVCEMDKLLDLNLVEKDDKGYYLSKDNYVKICEIYVDLVSRFGVPFIKKIRSIVIADNADEMYGKEIQDKWLDSRFKYSVENDKAYLSYLSKNEWNTLNDDSEIRKSLESLYNQNQNNKAEAVPADDKIENSEHNINIELIKKDEHVDPIQPVQQEERKSEEVPPNDEWEDSTHPDLAKFYNVL